MGKDEQNKLRSFEMAFILMGMVRAECDDPEIQDVLDMMKKAQPSLGGHWFNGLRLAVQQLYDGNTYGAVPSFRRGRGGHVGFVVGQSADHKRLRVRGGNQSNSVRDSWLAASRLIDLLWPKSWLAAHQRPMPIMDASGSIHSTNEARDAKAL